MGLRPGGMGIGGAGLRPGGGGAGLRPGGASLGAGAGGGGGSSGGVGAGGALPSGVGGAGANVQRVNPQRTGAPAVPTEFVQIGHKDESGRQVYSKLDLIVYSGLTERWVQILGEQRLRFPTLMHVF